VKLLYICGPYRAKTEWEVRQNILQAEYYAAEITRKYPEWFCVIPHKNTAYFGGLQPDQYFLDGTMELLRRCDGIYLLPNWEKSVGARAEKAEAERLGIKDYTEELEV
jgi:hypothetical protein